AFGQSVDIDEEVEALLEPVGQQLDMTEMGDIETGLAHGRFSFPFGAVRLLKRLSQPASGRQRKLGQMGCVTNSPVRSRGSTFCRATNHLCRGWGRGNL